MKRIHRLLYPNAPNRSWAPVLSTVLILSGAATALMAWQKAPATPYENWLNEDVVYIIADAERSAFEKLTTDDERQQFIQQFWLRRDPTPGTAANEYMDEHYRRIGYANERFRTRSGRRGWQTDRGRMYIIYGPPDEIEVPPSGPPAPVEAWLYHHVEGIGDRLIFTFVDAGKTGDFRLAPSKGK